jgi:hypothetical protein
MPIATQYKDPKRDGYYLCGWALGNCALYRSAAKAFKGDVAKLRGALAAKQFEGEINADGSLLFMGATMNWRDFEVVP